MKNQKKNMIILLIVLGVILYFCFKDDFLNVVREITKISPLWLFIAIFYVLLYLFIRTINLNMILKQFKKEYSLKNTFKIVLATSFFDSITPFSSGGQPAEIYFLNKEGFKITDATNSVIQQSIIFQFGLVIIGIITIILNYALDILEMNSLLKVLTVIGFGINIFVILVLLFLSFSKKTNSKLIKYIIITLGKVKLIKNPEEKLKEINNNIEKFTKNSKLLFKNHKLLLKTTLLSILSFAILYLIPLYIAIGLDMPRHFNVIETIVSSSYVMMIGSFIPIPGGSGGIEYGFMRFYGAFVSGSKLKALMLLWRFATYYFVILIGSIAIFRIKKRKE